MDFFDTATSLIGRGVVELLRALADGVELGLDVVCPVVTPPQLDTVESGWTGTVKDGLITDLSDSVAASAGAAVKDPAGVESPTAPAGQPIFISASDTAMNLIAAVTGSGKDDEQAHLATSEIVWKWIHEPEWFDSLPLGLTVQQALDAMK